MTHFGTMISCVGLLILVHAGYSTAHFQQFREDGEGDSAPLDSVVEAFTGFIVCAVGVMTSAGSFLPIKGASGGGKTVDAAESTREFQVFQHRGRSLRKRLENR